MSSYNKTILRPQEWTLSHSNFYWLTNHAPVSNPSFFPQYPAYECSWSDLAFVAGWTVIFAVLREVMMRGVFAPFMRYWIQQEERKRLARKGARTNGKKQDAAAVANGHSSTITVANGHGINGAGDELRMRKAANDKSSVNGVPSKSKRMTKRQRLEEKKVTRFAEQGWSLFYYVVYWSLGMWIHINSPCYPFNLDNLWIGYPHTPIPGPVKFYYLSQLAFWLNQIIVLNVEERRKDHYQMMTHHIITTTLMIMSYVNGFTRVGCLVLVLFDLCDILLPLAKMFKYMSLEPLPDITFGLFLLSWLVTRQGLYTLVVRSVIFDTLRLLPFLEDGAPEPAMSIPRWATYSALLTGLAILSLIWLLEIVRIAKDAIMGKPVEDTRSDEDDD
ncbi:sphingosine N-acyltransferase lag1 [Tulasnella sp. 427]|nr:sphingosine N-acyltransferase lag1 [Tulasnella sp. 427]